MDDPKKSRDDQDLPGYPHYPADEDIMNPQSGFKKIAADEELANSSRLSGRNVNERTNPDDTTDETEDDLQIVRGTEADVTKDDIALLGARNADQDSGDDELTGNARVDATDEEDPDLDVPGADLDDEQESIGEEDEENNYYSLGGDRHESLEEDPNAND
jgi:hypothetical protein